MKKALALVLALVMVLSMAVSAFAAVTFVDDFEKDTTETEYDINFANAKKLGENEKNEVLIFSGEGGTYYTAVENNFKTLEVSVDNDFVTAELIDYDPETMTGGEKFFDFDYHFGIKGEEIEYSLVPGSDYQKLDKFWNPKTTDYDSVKAACDAANEEYKTLKYAPVAHANFKVLKVVVADNYTVDYKEATIKLVGTGKETDPDAKGRPTYDKNTYTAKITVISDVAIWEHNTVLYAAEEEDALEIHETKNGIDANGLGYSAYLTKGDYNKADTSDKVYDEDEMRYRYATVVATTSFRAIAGKKLVVEANGERADVTVTIPEVAQGQKGVNFMYKDEFTLKDKKKPEKGWKDFSFGFKGNQTIASDYTIDVDLNMTYFQLRQNFKEKLEEEDVLKFYILKDGKAFDELVVDYMTVDDSEYVEFQIVGKAGTNLGYYTVTLTAPAAEEAGETNPDTGAESMIGVVAAMAVVTLASAAAISLKK